MHDQWPIASRVVHISGGLRAESPPRDNRVFIYPTHNDAHIFETIENFESLYSLCQKYGLILGVDFYQSEDEVQGIYPPEWRLFTYEKGGWLGFELSQKMAEIRHSAYCKENYHFVDSINKIEVWTKAAYRSLRSISDSYNTVLFARCKIKELSLPQAFDDINCDYIYDSLHNFFYYTGTLRDHIAEFIILHIFPKCIEEMRRCFPRLKDRELLKMSKLKKFIDSHNNTIEFGEIESNILSAYDIHSSSNILPGWMYMLNKYRNIITHERPIHMAACKAWSWHMPHSVDADELSFVKFPIPRVPLVDADYFPEAPDEIKKKLVRTGASRKFLHENPDGLDIAWRILLQLIVFLDHVMNLSPVAPEPICFDRSNSWNFRVVSNS